MTASRPIVYVDRSKIRPGKLDELRIAMDHLARFVEANVPKLRVTVHGFHAGFDRG